MASMHGRIVAAFVDRRSLRFVGLIVVGVHFWGVIIVMSRGECGVGKGQSGQGQIYDLPTPCPVDVER